MTRYRYSATDADGEWLEGELDHSSLADAIADLESRGWQVGSIELVDRANESVPQDPEPTDAFSSSLTSPFVLSAPSSTNRLRSHFDSVFEQREQLIPALQALVAELPGGTARRELNQLTHSLETVRSGSELSSSKNATRWLPLLMTGLTEGSSTHRLGDLLTTAARESRNRNERRKVLVYPILVLLIALLVLTMICVVIVPSFRKMFDEFGLMLPYPTTVLIEISTQFTDHLFKTLVALVVAGILIAIAAQMWIKFGLTNQIFGRMSAGSASNVSAMASLVGQLSDLLSIGISLPDAIWLAGEGCNHRFYQRAAEELARFAYDSGQPLNRCPAADRFPGNVIHALSAGPDGMPHLELLRELSAMYSDHSTQRTSWISGAAAQLAIVLVGLCVGFVVIALFAPLISLISGLS
ncbi:MAG: type II secretion system F family protein [Planctomycetota bacterium]